MSDDEDLLRAYARRGDEDAFREIVRRYSGLVYAACLRDLRDGELAEDATGEVFLALARGAARVRVRSSLVPWLYGTARLVCRAARRTDRRRRSREAPLDAALDAGIAAPAGGPAFGETDALLRALDALGQAEREAIVLRYLRGLSLAEVGRAQGVSEDAARMRVGRALKRLRTEFVPVLAPPLGLAARLARLPLPRPAPLMTAPALLAPAVLLPLGIAAVALANANRPAAAASTAPVAAQRRPAPSPKTALPKIAPAKTTNAKSGKPVAPAALTRPFTLVYHAEYRNLRTPAMNEAILAQRAKEWAEDVDADRLTPQDVEKRLAALRAHLEGPPDTAEITLAWDGETLLFDERPDGGWEPNPNVNLFDGKTTVHVAPGVRNLDSQGTIYPGTVQHDLRHLPYIGPSLPRIPLTRGKDVFASQAYDEKLAYYGGTVQLDRQGIAKRILVGRARPAPEETVLTEPVAFGGTSIARRSVMTRRDYYLDTVAKGAPFERITYTLVSMSPAVDPARFRPETYLADGDIFRAYTVDPNGRYFKYERAKGSLAAQIAATRPGDPRPR